RRLPPPPAAAAPPAARADPAPAGRSCYRCDTVVEPRLSEQWFVRMEPLARPALQASRDGTVTFAPDRWTRVYEHWMENIRDWCISRQLWWGHRIPVWYCGDCGAVMACREDPDRCGECGSAELEQDPDVLDTWFSSWLWPFSVFGWPERTRDLGAFYPGHTLSTAPEILFFWVARMIMSGYHAMGAEPFRRVYLHGTVRDIQGRKMSKSLGNGIDPLEVVDLYGADALRFTLIASAGVGADIRLDHEDLEAAFSPGRNFVNKLWNAGRFALMSLGDEPVPGLAEVTDDLALEDRWILSRQQRAIRRTGEELEGFRIHGAAEVLRDFFRGEFADWYLECVKHRLRPGGPGRDAARAVLLHVLDTICRLLHPMVPFVTEELWGLLPGAPDTPLIVARWPEEAPALVDERAEADFDWLRDLVVSVRGMRKEYRVGEGREVTVHVTAGAGAAKAGGHTEMLRRLARIGAVEAAPPGPGTVGASAVLRDGTELFLPLAGVIDVDRELERLERETGRLEGRLKGLRAKLANENFVTRAPEAVVARERDKLASCQVQFTKLQEKLTFLRGNGE
ncbi:MAG: class I tRNA ligase family protein, partial [Gemmatimonadetes bacterium]|nr:class I tRNA ligase family protein [Gemmatimonadota bacterium]